MIPEKIYLQWAPDAGDEITWCVDRINDNDIEYMRAPRPMLSVPADSPDEAACYLADKMDKYDVEELIDKLIDVTLLELDRVALGQRLLRSH